MGYAKIKNLYREPDFLQKHVEVFSTEKIHGSSAHVSWNGKNPEFFAGGESHRRFVEIFDQDRLRAAFTALGHDDVIVFGEVYGGKCQGMKHTYGPDLKFVAFDVRVGMVWQDVPSAVNLVAALGLEFVEWERGPCTLEWLTSRRDAPSVQAVRNGITEPRPREGIVIHPIVEGLDEWGERILFKYKNEAFQETASPREVDPSKIKVLEDAKAVASEWVVPMRLAHVLDKIQAAKVEDTGAVIRAMTEDIRIEGADEIVWSKDVEREIGKAAARLFKKHLEGLFREGGVSMNLEMAEEMNAQFRLLSYWDRFVFLLIECTWQHLVASTGRKPSMSEWIDSLFFLGENSTGYLSTLFELGAEVT